MQHVQKYNNKINPQRRLDALKFKLAIILGLINHCVVTGPVGPLGIQRTEQEIAQ